MRKAGNFWLILLFMLAGCSDQTNETATGGTTSDPVEAEVVDAVTDIAEATGRLAEKLRDD